MTRRRRRTAVASLLLALALALASVLLSAPGAGASTRTEPLCATFENLMPGSTASASWGLELDRAAVVAEVTTAEAGPGGVEWDVRLCARSSGACTVLTDGVRGVRLAAGTYDLQVAVVASDALPPAETNTLDGRVVFAAADTAGTGTGTSTAGPWTGGGPATGTGPLAMTGLPALSLLLAAVATALVGLLLLLGARRRRDEDDAPLPSAVSAPDGGPERRRAP